MNSMGVNSEEETMEEQPISNTYNESTDAENTSSIQEEEQQETPAPVMRVRRSFGESIVGRFKGFFENDEAMN